MTRAAPTWDENPKLPPGVSLFKAIGLFVLLQCLGPSLWSVAIIGLQAGWDSTATRIALLVWAVPLLLAAAIALLALTRRAQLDRLISFTGYFLFRGILIGFCFLGVALAYGSDALVPSVWTAILGLAVVEIYAYLNARAFSDEKIITLMRSSFSKVDERGRFQLQTHGPGVPEGEMWLKGGVQYRLIAGLVLLSPFLLALAVTGRADAIAGPIMLTIGLLLYFLAVGTWAGQHALHRAIRLRQAGRF